MKRGLIVNCTHRWIIPLIVFAALILILMPASGVEADSIVTFSDTNLETAVRQAIGKASGDIYQSDLVGLTSLIAKNKGIVNLGGLENCTSLWSLDLSSNQISDISQLSFLTGLTNLLLMDNQISQISSLSSLTSLTMLGLGENQISDISPLSPLTNLGFLILWNNRIYDIQPLVNNSGIASGDSVYLTGNPLNSNSVSTCIPTLTGRGVTVLWDTINQPPNQPNNVSPVNAATDIGLTPTLQSSAFSDPDAGDTHAATQWQITNTSGNYSTLVFDSGTDNSNLTSIAISSGNLNYSTTYYWHVRHQDKYGAAWSSWSVETSFITMAPPIIYTISAAQAEDTNPVMTSHTVTATIAPVAADVKVGIEVVSGPNAGEKGTGSTNASGQFTFTYTGDGGGGTDTIRAWVDYNSSNKFDEGEPFATVTKDWLVNFVTGGGTIKIGKGSPLWTFAGNVGFLDDGNLTVAGQYNIVDHANKVNWHCHNDISSLVFSGVPTRSSPASHNIATFIGHFTNNKGEAMDLKITITDNGESGKSGDNILVQMGPTFTTNLFSGNPISTGNLQVHDGYK